MPLTTDTIYEWRDSQRKPDLGSDLDKIKEALDGDDAAYIVRAYINYLTTFHQFHEDCERDTCAFLTNSDGPYKEILLKAYIEDTGSSEDFEEIGLSLNGLLRFSCDHNERNAIEEFTYRYLKCFELTLKGLGSDIDNDSLKIPSSEDLGSESFRVNIKKKWLQLPYSFHEMSNHPRLLEAHSSSSLKNTLI